MAKAALLLFLGKMAWWDAGAQVVVRLQQARNGTPEAPISAVDWVSTAIGPQQGHYVEHSSVPYRLVFDTVLPGAHRVVIAWDTKTDGQHATDYLTHYNRLLPHSQFGAHNVPETIQPLRDISGGPQGPSTFPIPSPDGPGSFGSLPANQRVFNIFNGTITAATYLVQGSLSNASAESRMAIDFTANQPPVVILFGGHLASKAEWGVGSTAAGVTGLVYRVRLVEVDGLPNLSNVAVSAPAVVAPPVCNISGPNPVCPGTTNTYTAATDAAAATFTWTLTENTAGASIIGANIGPVVQVRAGNGGGRYTLQVTVSHGPLHSACAQTVEVLTNASTTPLVNVAVCAGGTATFNTEPAGTGPFRFMWRKGPQILQGQTNKSLTLSKVNTADGGLYCVEVTGPCNTATTCAALIVNSNTTATPLADLSRCVGEGAVFSTTAGGTGPFSYRWRKNGVEITGQTNRIYVIPNLALGDAGVYTVEVSGFCNSATNSARLTVYNLPPCGMAGPATVCPDSGGISFVGPTNMVGYRWTITGNGIAVGPTNQQAVTVASMAPGFLTVGLIVVNSNGCSRSCSRTITVGDIEAPSIICPDNLQTNTEPGRCSQRVEFATRAVDNCAGVTVTCDPPSATEFPKGSTSVNCTAIDRMGNQATCSFTVAVVDLEKPTLTCPTSLVANTEAGLCEAKVTYEVTVTDNCPGTTLICSPPSGTVFPLGTSTVTCRGSDAAGNIESCSFDVTVVDAEGPQITCSPDLTFFTDPGQCDVVADYEVRATDNCAMSTVVCVPPSGSLFSQGVTTVTCVAKDVNDNQSRCSFEVQVDDSEKPRMVCPGDISTMAEAGRCDGIVNFTYKTGDNCPGATVTCVPPSGSRFAVGQTNVTCTASDSSGNTTSCTFKVTVLDDQRPVLTCPQNVAVNTSTGRCDAVVQYAVAVTDNCLGASFQCVPPSGSVFAAGSTTVSCFATDGSGNTASCAFHVVVQDTELPAVTCPADITTNAASGECSAYVGFDISMTDNCPGAEVFCEPQSGSPFLVGQTPVYCVAVDTSGNVRDCIFLVTVNDVERPVISCPANLTVNTAVGRCDAVANFTATAADNCAALPVTCAPPSGSLFPKGTNVVICTAEDTSGNSATCTFRVTVEDHERPAIVCPANVVAGTEPGHCDAPVTFSASASDNCAVASISCVPASGTRFLKGTTPVVCTARDSSGNEQTCSFTVTIHDNQPPTITCPTNLVVNTSAGRCDAVVSFTPALSDNCPGTTFVCSPPSGAFFVVGQTPVTCVATDASGNTNRCTFAVTVQDREKPAIACPANILTATEPGRCDALASFAANASDNCGVASVTCAPPSGTRFSKGTTAVLCTARDTSGNEESCSFAVTIQDTQPPTVTCPTNQIVAAEQGRCDAPVSFAPAFSDNCSGVTVVCSPPSGTRFVVGQTPVTCVATDASGNTNRCGFFVKVEDRQAPTIICPADITTVTAPARCDAEVVFNPSASDNCPGVTVQCVPPSGSRFSQGASVVACTATDASSNAVACAFTVRVNDNQPPVVTCPTNIVANTSTGRCDAVVSYVATAADNCSATLVCAPPAGATFAKGVTTVNCVATDASGNTNRCSFTVSVQDREKPVITCPQAQELFTQPGVCDAVATFEASATDNCAGVSVICLPPSGSRFAKGVNSVTCTATDAGGNTESCSFTVTVRDIDPPALTCPTNIVTATDAGRCDAIVHFAPTAVDGCTGMTVVCVPPTGARFVLGATTVNCSATDAGSNTVTCAFTVSVEDRENPQLICSAGLVTNTAPGRCDQVVGFVPAIVDNCAGAQVFCEPPAGSTFPQGTNTVVCIAIDTAGNQDSCAFSLIVADTEPPGITCSADISVPTEPGRCDAAVTFAASASDNCSQAAIACAPPSGSRFAKGVTTVVCTATDASGNSANCSVSVTVSDHELPVVICPQDLILNTELGLCSARANFSAQVTDNCPGATVACLPPPNSAFSVGTTTVLCQGIDAAGNAQLCAFDVHVIDEEPPRLICPDDLTVDTEPTQCTATVFFEVGGDDACGMTNLVCAPPSGSLFARGVTLVQCRARDGSGNEATCAFDVTVRDAEAPNLLCPTNIIVAAILGRCDAVVDFVPSASDNCNGANVVCTPPSGSTFTLGSTMVHCTASDNAENTSQCTFSVRVIDSQRPVLTCSSNLIINCESNRCDAMVMFTTSVTDNCGAMALSCTPPSDSRFAVGLTSVTCSSTDAAGNVGICGFTVTVRDNQPPTVQCPAGIVAPAVDGRCDAPVTFNASASDNCGSVPASCFPPSGSYFPMGTSTVTCSAMDAHFNVGSCQFTVTVRDMDPPSLQCPADILANTTTGRCDAVVSFGPQATDNCSPVTVACVPPSGSIFAKGTNFVTCTATDAHTNSVNCTFRVIVRDVEKPQIICQGDLVASTEAGECRARVSYSPTATDNCSGVTVACNPPSASWFNKGVTLVLCVATDASGNTNRCSFSVTVNDTIAPTITCPANIATNATHGQVSTIVQFAPGFTDNCPGASYSCTPQSGSVFQRGTTQVTCTATDASGNTRSCSFTVSVNDTEPPVINCPTNLIVATAFGRCDAVANYMVTATDNSQNVTLVCAPPSGSVLPKGTNNVLCTATDGASNSVSCAFAVVVADQEKPVIACPANMVINTERGRCDARVTYVTNATDNCGLASLSCNPPSGATLSKGTNIVTCTASDSSGNTETCTFTVRVVDNEAPSVNCPTNMIVALTPGQCDVMLNYSTGVADNCPGATVSCSPPSGSFLSKGTITVNCTARDTSGNTAACSFVVDVRDQEAPVITCPADMNNLSYPGSCGAPVVYSATVRDNCPGATISCNPPSGSMMPIGTNSVTCNAADASGNTASCTFRVMIRDLERPVLTCPGDIVIDGSGGNCSPIATYAPTVHDNCPNTTVTCMPPSGSTFAAGTNQVQCVAFDPSGNMSSCAFSVIMRVQPLTATPLESQTRCMGQTATFTTAAGGSGPFTFAWMKNGVPMPAHTNATLVRSNLTMVDSGNYAVVVRSPCNSVTNSATLGVNAPVAITGMTNVTRCDCDPLVLSPLVSGAGPFSYVWRKNGSVLSGATGSTLAFTKLSTNDAGMYTVEVSGACNSAVANATITVISVPNPAVYTNSGAITIRDNAVAFPYPSSIRVTCVQQPVRRATVTLRGFTHAYPDDVDMMLAAPDGRCVMLMSDAGDGALANNVNITLDDAAVLALPDTGQLFTGAFRPGNYDTDADAFPLPAPKLTPANGLLAFAGTLPNGFWSLFVVDDFQLESGVINNGWVLRLYWESAPVRLTAPRMLPNGGFQMTVIGDAQTTHVIEASSDLVNWAHIATITLSGPQTDFTDPNPAEVRFYRATQP